MSSRGLRRVSVSGRGPGFCREVPCLTLALAPALASHRLTASLTAPRAPLSLPVETGDGSGSSQNLPVSTVTGENMRKCT
ncbi:hypothetical protein DPEC_G00221870 [Dallia pectoralis]|uniref:Uncharacterized protein n=1 Tax=Dallia pectoralis TaxID=75939 RepID=A0ACC2G4H2_DALPE|nr:hypothetical protein DPEC_G00221870 [Dallia pectoralis]